MRKLLLVGFLFFINFIVLAQLPTSFNYQVIIRNSSKELLSNKDIDFRISILQNSISGTDVYVETQSAKSNDFGVCNLKIGDGDSQNDFTSIDWSEGSYFLKIEIDIDGTSNYEHIGTSELLSVPFSLYACKAIKSDSSKNSINSDTALIARKIDEEVLYFTNNDTLFAVKDRSGNIVFAVFPDGAKVYVNEGIKGRVGGFAISGRSPTKTSETEYMVVTSDSTRIYVDQSTKGRVGGFAISGRSPTKASVVNFMDLTPENYFIGHNSGINIESAFYNSFLGYNTGMKLKNGNSNVFIGYNTGVNLRKGFSNVFIGNESGFNTDTASSNVFIGDEAGKNNTKGQLNVFIGYQTGLNNTTGSNNSFIGNWSGVFNISGHSNSFYGTTSGVKNETGDFNTFIGNSAGYNNIDGSFNFAGGYTSLYNLKSGESNVALGANSAFNVESGNSNVYIGSAAASNKTSGDYNVFVGAASGFANTSGEKNVFIGHNSGYTNDGSYNVFIGNYSGGSVLGSNKLWIDNANYSKPLIGGDFLERKVNISHMFNISAVDGYPSNAVEGDIIRLKDHSTDPDGLYIYTDSEGWKAILNW